MQNSRYTTLASTSPHEYVIISHAVHILQDRSEGAFSEWMEKNNKSYSSDEERARRYKIWLDNLEYIEAYNAKGGSSHVRL